ncbi:tRNA 2-thiouridine synthesizing protein E (EC 2.8.1.-), partial [Pseudomonas fluorescens]
ECTDRRRPRHRTGQGRFSCRSERLVGRRRQRPGRRRRYRVDWRTLGNPRTAAQLLCRIPAVPGHAPADQVHRVETRSGQRQQPAPQPTVQRHPCQTRRKTGGPAQTDELPM